MVDTLGGPLQLKPLSNLPNNIIVIVVPSIFLGQPRLPVLNDMNFKSGSTITTIDPSYFKCRSDLNLKGSFQSFGFRPSRLEVHGYLLGSCNYQPLCWP
ncbi:isoleucine N-monooxygenase [Trifolium repens]|nr:isoleucine N-monooxygenase [Trifolium repens]